MFFLQALFNDIIEINFKLRQQILVGQICVFSLHGALTLLNPPTSGFYSVFPTWTSLPTVAPSISPPHSPPPPPPPPPPITGDAGP